MTELRKIFGTSLLSLMLVIWGLFMVCSGRVPDVVYEDDFMVDDVAFQDDLPEDDNSELMTQLAVLDDDETTRLEDHQRNEILEALGIDLGGSEISRKEEEEFLNEELFLDLEVEIAELEKLNKRKNTVADSLRTELQDADYHLTALNRVVGEEGAQYASSTRTAPRLNAGSNSQFAAEYQDALDEVYSRRFTAAIAKFRQLLLQMDIRDNLADNCQYWIAESYYAMASYEAAIAEFEKVFAFDNNNKEDDAQFMIGLTYIKLGNSSLAQMELQNLMIFYQDSEYVARAEREFGELNI
ncbi:MAG: tol-pal system YbgF family protein [bacterium]